MTFPSERMNVLEASASEACVAAPAGETVALLLVAAVFAVETANRLVVWNPCAAVSLVANVELIGTELSETAAAPLERDVYVKPLRGAAAQFTSPHPRLVCDCMRMADVPPCPNRTSPAVTKPAAAIIPSVIVPGSFRYKMVSSRIGYILFYPFDETTGTSRKYRTDDEFGLVPEVAAYWYWGLRAFDGPP